MARKLDLNVVNCFLLVVILILVIITMVGSNLFGKEGFREKPNLTSNNPNNFGTYNNRGRNDNYKLGFYKDGTNNSYYSKEYEQEVKHKNHHSNNTASKNHHSNNTASKNHHPNKHERNIIDIPIHQ